MFILKLALPFLMHVDTFSHFRVDTAQKFFPSNHQAGEHTTKVSLFPELMLLEAISDLIRFS